MNADPRRLVEEAGAPEALRSDLAVAARADAIGFDVDAGLQRLEAAIGGSTVEVASSSGASSGGLALGLGLGVGGLGALALVLLFGFGAGPSSQQPAQPGLAGPVAASVASPVADPDSQPLAAEAVARAPSSTNPARVGAVARERSDRADSLDQALHDAPEVTRHEVGTQADGDERSESKRRHKPSKAHASELEPVSAERPDDRYLREVRQLHRARGELASDPKRALELAKAGQREFSAGALQQEWEGLIILALDALGERDEAARRGDAFLEKYPDGPFSAKIRRALGN